MKFIPLSPQLVAFITKAYFDCESVSKTKALVELEYKKPISTSRISEILKNNGIRVRHIPSIYDTQLGA